jgi:glycine betaine/proline transport system ATP-binding protein
MRLGDRIAVMHDGRIVQIGTAEDILTQPANDYVARFVQDVNRSRVLTARSIMEKPSNGADAGNGAGESVSPELPIADLCAVSAHSRYPVAVKDDAGKLLGVVSQSRLLAALGEGASGDGEGDEQGGDAVHRAGHPGEEALSA